MNMQDKWSSGDRFSLLLLQEGEYYFKDYTCHYYPGSNAPRVSGHLKLCSLSLFFVPRNVHEPIFRIPSADTDRIVRCPVEERPTESLAKESDFFMVYASKRIDVKMGNRNVPYAQHKGEFKFCFSLVYTDTMLVAERARILLNISRKPPPTGPAELAEIIQEHEDAIQFDPRWVQDEDEDIKHEGLASKITPLVSHPGRVVLTNTRVYFQPFNIVSSSPIQIYDMEDVISVQLRDYALEPTGLEIFFSEVNSLYLSFKTKAARTSFHQSLLQQPGLVMRQFRARDRWVEDWVQGRISNYDYLMYLNREADRSFNDLTQYPVFPWVIKDFSSPTLDLDSPSTFRNLSRPIGALNPERLDVFRQRYEDMLEMQDLVDTDNPMNTPPFLYGCHYSTPGYVVYYLLRKDPQLMLRLQNGKFDMPDRMMWSVAETFMGVYTNPHDLKELTPEFYTLPPTFLINSERLDFGVTQENQVVDDVELPLWANDPYDFVHKMREALESPFASAHIHHWIDLIFGYKQRGEAAIAADNVYHHLTYADVGKKQLDAVTDPVLKGAIRVQMMEFGRQPKQLFITPHPQRATRKGLSSVLLSCVPSCGQSPGEEEEKEGDFQAEVLAAVRRVTVGSMSDRTEALEWLEAQAKSRPPEAMEIEDTKCLLPLVKMCRQDEALQALAIRTLLALARTEHNLNMILNAGCLECLVDVLCDRGSELLPLALSILTELVILNSPLLMSFNLSALATLIHMLRAPPSEVVLQGSMFTLAHLTRSEVNRSNMLALSGLEPVIELLDTDQATLQLHAAHAVMMLCVDDETKRAFVDAGGLPPLMKLLETPDKRCQVAAVRCFSVLSSTDTLKERMAAVGVLRLLCSVSCSEDDDLQQWAAEAVSNLCMDGKIVNQVVEKEGLWCVLNMAQSPNVKIQRHAARALWYIVFHDNDKRKVLRLGGLGQLLRLSQMKTTNVQASLLADEALTHISQDPTVLQALEEEMEEQHEAAEANLNNSLLNSQVQLDLDAALEDTLEDN